MIRLVVKSTVLAKLHITTARVSVVIMPQGGPSCTQRATVAIAEVHIIAIRKVRPIGVELRSDVHERTPKLDWKWDLNHVVVICSFANTVDFTTSLITRE